MIALRSPVSQRPLVPDGAHALRTQDGGERWPVIDGIPYLRVGSEGLAAEALCALDAGDETAALLLLLPENDAWWDGLPPARGDLQRLLAERDRLSLREAMALLGWGRVGTYFAHRWSDPTFLAGLALLDAHWPRPRAAFELACGIGHYLRAISRHCPEVIGADVVFAKLWVARHWVAPRAQLICFDATAPWPIKGQTDLAFCHDAFYFFDDKAAIAARLSALAPVVALSHVHNRDRPNLSEAKAVTLTELRALFHNARFYSDEALTDAAVSLTVPQQGDVAGTEAFALVSGGGEPRSIGKLLMPSDGSPLRRNPLLVDGIRQWPSARYAQEYGARATYRADARVPDAAIMTTRWAEAVARRELIDLPERW